MEDFLKTYQLHSKSPTYVYITMQETIEEVIDEDKRIVLALHGWTSLDKMFPPCTLGDECAQITCS